MGGHVQKQLLFTDHILSPFIWVVKICLRELPKLLTFIIQNHLKLKANDHPIQLVFKLFFMLSILVFYIFQVLFLDCELHHFDSIFVVFKTEVMGYGETAKS